MLDRLGGYKIEAEIGSGGMGKVYAAVVDGDVRNLARGARVALKLVHPHLLESPGFFKRFLREARIGQAVRHPNVVRTLDCDAVLLDGEQRNFLVMEYVEGQTLRQLLDELGPLPEQLCRHVAVEVGKALIAVHHAGVVHRDLKPENVLITPDHVVKLMDLGVARLLDESTRLSSTGSFVGSLQYAAPEQFRKGGSDVDGRADLHSLGVLLYELASGVNPFDADDTSAVVRNVLEKIPRRLGALRPQISPFFEEIVRTLLEKDRNDRLFNARELVTAMDAGEDSDWWRQRARDLRASTRAPLRRVRIPRETALYGRQDEVAQLSAMFGRVRDGHGRVLLIDGEAGIGKTRLVDEVIGRLAHEGEDLHFLFGSYPPGGAATDAGAFCTAYREHFGADGLEGAIAPYLRSASALGPAFAALLRGEPPPRGEEPLTKDTLQAVFVSVTRALAAERPTVVLIDDLHFTSDDGRGLFAALAAAVPGHRILLIGTTRPGLRSNWIADLERLPQLSRMPIHRLGAKDLTNLLMDAFHSRRLAETLGFDVAAKSDGNPFFVFEIIRSLRNEERIAQRPDGSWMGTGAVGEIAIPDSVQDLVRGRIAELDEEEKDLLDVAACVGFEFDPLIVAEAAGLQRTPALKRLARIEARNVLVRSVGRNFMFDHHQVQEVLYAGLHELLREDYHRAIAGALVRRAGAAAAHPASLDGPLAWTICHHYLSGGDGAEGLRYLDAALAHLRDGYQNADRVALLDRALGLPDAVLGAVRIDLLLRKARTLDLLGRRPEQRAALDAAIVLADSLGDAAHGAMANRLLGWYFLALDRTEDARVALGKALHLAKASGDRSVEAQVTGNIGSLYHRLGREGEALEHHVKHMQIAEAIGSRRDLVSAHGNIAATCVRMGRIGEAERHYDRCLELARELGLRRDEAVATVNSCLLLVNQGQMQAAEDRSRAGLDLCRMIGFALGECVALDMLADALRNTGRAADALPLCERSIDVAREIGSRTTEVQMMYGLADALAQLRREDDAVATLDAALAVAEEIGDRVEIARCELGLARFDHEGARHDAAIRRLRRAIALSGAADRRELLVPAAARLAVLEPAEVENAAAAREAAGPGLPCSVEIEARYLMWLATGEASHLAGAAAALCRLRDGTAEEHRAALLANVPLHRAVAEALPRSPSE